jgi:hypothetical protein
MQYGGLFSALRAHFQQNKDPGRLRNFNVIYSKEQLALLFVFEISVSPG